MEIRSYRDLQVWQLAMDLAVAVYELTKDWPSEERFGLISQSRRSSVSIAANIAEGYGRDNLGSYVQFLKTAQGSLKELETHLLIAERVGVDSRDRVVPLMATCEGLGKMLRALVRKLEEQR